MATETETKTVTDVVATSQEVGQVVKEDKDLSLDKVTDKTKSYYAAIAKSLNEHDMTSVIDYGSDLQKAMDSYSSEVLNQQISSKSDTEVGKLVADLRAELMAIDVDDFNTQNAFKRFMRKIPLLNRLVVSIDQLQVKYNSTMKNIDGIVEKIEATKQIALRDNNLLEKQLENNIDYIKQLADLIIAGKMKSKELKEQIRYIEDGVEPGTELQLHDLKDYVATLDKRITDLILLRYAFQQSLIQIRIIQNTNMMDIVNTESQIKMAVPLWKHQLVIAISLFNQQKSIAIKNKFQETTNQIMMKNAEMIKTLAPEVVRQNQRSVIDIETLRKTTSDLLATVEGVQKAQKEGAAKRASAEAEIKRLEAQVATAANGTKETTERIIAAELKKANGNWKTDMLLD